MVKADLHIHSNMSPDSKEDIDSICLKAIELGLDTIAISDHYEFYWPGREHNIFNFKHVEEEHKIVEKARIHYNGSLNILFAIEIGQPHLDFHNAMRLTSSFDFDFILASFHKVGGTDLAFHDYQDDEERRRTLLEYLDGLLLIASAFDFDSLAHLDLVKRYSLRHGRMLGIEEEEERVRAVLKTLAMRGKALEVNTSLLRSYVEPMPSQSVLRWFKEEGGEFVTLGSDAHRSSDIAFEFDSVYDMINSCGFSSPVIYKNRRPCNCTLSGGSLC